MATNYWNRVLQNRVTRRRAMVATSGAAFSAAFIAACGSDDDGGSSGASPTATAASGSTGSTGSSGATGATGTTSGLLSKAEDTTAQAKVGGTLISTNPADPPHFDPHLLTLPAAAPTSLIFSKLLRIKPGAFQPTGGEAEADLAESWEFSPDNLTLTMKIRQDAGTPDDDPILKGRKLDADDVLFSWNRWAEKGSNRQDLVNSVNSAAPILSLEATDSTTIVIKLAAPTASLLAALGAQLQGQFFILPKEADGGFDVEKEPHGAGPYSLDEYIPSSRLRYKLNPNRYDMRSYPEFIETPIITENAQVIAQITAGNIHTHYRAFPPESVVQIKKDQEKISLYQSAIANVGVSTFFGFKADPADKSPFRDERVRQAWSMAIDTDLYLDAFGNVSKFAEDGLAVETAWNAGLDPDDYAGWWLDPQGSSFGANAKFFGYDLTEAKALLAAAGFPDGLDVISNEAAGTNYGLSYARLEAIHGMVADAGFRIERLQHQAPAPWNAEYRDSHGYFEGVGFRLTPVPAEPRDALFSLYNVNGSLNYGFDPDGIGSTSPDAVVGDAYADEITTKIRQTFDNDEAIALAHELQQYLGGKQYFSRALGSATSFNVAWPAVKNFEVFQGLQWGYLWKEYWLDQSLPPFA